jgi:stearoyl-CoA 9-desaturase NADPH oxidoreductase
MMSGPFFRAPAVARAAWHRWFLDRKAEFWLGELRPSWSLRELRGRVVEVVAETADAKTFSIAVPRAWPGHRAGQYVPIEVEIDGVRVRRCYSISSGSSARGAGRIAITVKRVPGGRVSRWLHGHLAPGAIVRLGTPTGDFVVADPTRPLLLVAAGSGITPIMAIVRDLSKGARCDAVVVHAARSDADAIFGRELAALADITRGLRTIAHRGRLDATSLAAYAPDAATRETFACGPSGFMALVTDVVGPHVRVEHFTPPSIVRPAPVDARVARLAHCGRSVALDGNGTLLEQLERAGERPNYGCRMGICNTCRCTKTSGAVLDLVTGVISSAPDQEIRLCVSVPRSDLELEL